MSDSFGGFGPGPVSRPEPVEPPQRSGGARVLLWILVIVVIVGVALTGGAYAAGLIGGDDDPAAAPSSPAPTGVASAKPGSGGTAASTSGAGDNANGTMTVALPATLGGVKPSRAGDKGKNKPAASPDLFPVTARAEGVFGDDAQRNIVYVWAVSGSSTSEAERGALFSSEIDKRFKTGTMLSVEPGPLGGTAQCADGRWNGRAAAVCVWSDGYSNGVLVDSPGNPESLAGKLPALRAEVERPAA
ncbi:hypothetical protein AB0M54_30340 [Actinoplanes sp. NPDC051470]|uniref:hypothetical protein n=1 Tax=Actinoplanes sp. NPDC051470 TaxID=3157224 RepID=UPI00342B392C